MKKETKILLGMIILAVIFLLNLLLLWNILLSQQTLIQYQTYYYDKTENLDHEARQLICEDNGLNYLKSLQNSKEVILCCQMNSDIPELIDSCESILA